MISRPSPKPVATGAVCFRTSPMVGVDEGGLCAAVERVFGLGGVFFQSLLDVRDPSLDALQPRGCALFQRRKLCAYIVGVAGDLDSYRSQLDR